MSTTTWVVGASGLLGRHADAAAGAAGHRVLRVPVPWQADPPDVLAALDGGIAALRRAAADGPTSVWWVAGAGVVGSTAAELAAEQEVYERFCERLAAGAPPGTNLFQASSAGGVYAGSSGPPFTEVTPAVPLAPYGRARLAMESATRTYATATGAHALIGRIANLYGPGQNVDKPQGLVSQLARAALVRTPLQLYVSLDTTRDYLYVADAARLVVAAMGRLSTLAGRAATVTKVLASGRGTTIAELLGVFRRVQKRRVPVVLGDSPLRRVQVRDLRLRSTVWRDLDRVPTTPLPVGVSATIGDLAARLQAGALRPRLS